MAVDEYTDAKVIDLFADIARGEGWPWGHGVCFEVAATLVRDLALSADVAEGLNAAALMSGASTGCCGCMLTSEVDDKADQGADDNGGQDHCSQPASRRHKGGEWEYCGSLV
jgi:hypothetical protein